MRLIGRECQSYKTCCYCFLESPGETNKVTLIYGTRRPKPLLIDTEFDPADVDIFEIVNTNDLKALVEASAYLRNISDLSIRSHDLPYNKQGNFLLLGGPIANKSTLDFIDHLRPTFTFVLSPNHREIRNRTSTATYSPVFVDVEIGSDKKQRKIVSDVGWFIRTRNPFDSHSIGVIVAGIFGYATEGVVSCLTTDKYLRTLNNALKEMKKDQIEGIVEAIVDDDTITDVRLLAYQ